MMEGLRAAWGWRKGADRRGCAGTERVLVSHTGYQDICVHLLKSEHYICGE